MPRHSSDLAALDAPRSVDAAVKDGELAGVVAQHKSLFFAEKDKQGAAVDYQAAVSGHQRLVPDAKPLDALAEDYRLMVEDGLLADEATNFDDLMTKCRDIEHRANEASPSLDN